MILDVSKCFKLRHWQACACQICPALPCHAAEVLEASRAYQVMRGRPQLLSFDHASSGSSCCPSMFIVPKELYFSAFQEKTARKRLPKVPKKNSCRCWVLLCNLQRFANKTTTCRSMLIHVDAICQFYQSPASLSPRLVYLLRRLRKQSRC